MVVDTTSTVFLIIEETTANPPFNSHSSSLTLENVIHNYYCQCLKLVKVNFL